MRNPYPYITYPRTEEERQTNHRHDAWEANQIKLDQRAEKDRIAADQRAEKDRIAADQRAEEQLNATFEIEKNRKIQEKGVRRAVEDLAEIEIQRAQNDYELWKRSEENSDQRVNQVCSTLENSFSPDSEYDRKKASLQAERDDVAEQEQIEKELRRKEEVRRLEHKRLEVLDSQYKNTYREWKETEMGQQWLKSVTGSVSVGQKNIDLRLFENYKAYKKKKHIENENIKKSIASKISQFYDDLNFSITPDNKIKFKQNVFSTLSQKKWKQELRTRFKDIFQLEETLINNCIEVAKDDDPNGDYFVDFLEAKIKYDNSEQTESFSISNILKPRPGSYNPNAAYFDIIECSKARLYFEDEGTKKDICKIKKDFEKINEKTIHGDSRIQVITWKYPDEFISAIVNEFQESRRRRNQEIIDLIKDELKSFRTRMTKIFKETYIKEKKIHKEIIEIIEIIKQKKEEKKQEKQEKKLQKERIRIEEEEKMEKVRIDLRKKEYNEAEKRRQELIEEKEKREEREEKRRQELIKEREEREEKRRQKCIRDEQAKTKSIHRKFAIVFLIVTFTPILLYFLLRTFPSEIGHILDTIFEFLVTIFGWALLLVMAFSAFMTVASVFVWVGEGQFGDRDLCWKSFFISAGLFAVSVWAVSELI
jgi:hypothetical protein